MNSLAGWLLLYTLLSKNLLIDPNIVLANSGNGNRTVSLDKSVTARTRDPKSVVPKNFYDAPPNCNPHPYKYLINPSTLCEDKGKVFLLILIRTIFSQFDRRMAIRETWGNKTNFHDVNIVITFLFGRDKDLHLQPSIQRESEIYKDIIQEDFIESYGNLTLKTVMAWKWARQYCLHATFVMVMNDEIFVDVFKLIPYLHEIYLKPEYNDHFILCYLILNAYVQRTGKYTASNYSSNTYPSYCSGVAYAASMKVINQLYLMSINTPMYMPDDTWIGVLAEKLQLKFRNTGSSFVGVFQKSSFVDIFVRPDYVSKKTMIAVMDYVFPKKEAAMICHLWRLTIDHYSLRNEKGIKEINTAGYGVLVDDLNLSYMSIFLIVFYLIGIGIIFRSYFFKRFRNVIY